MKAANPTPASQGASARGDTASAGNALTNVLGQTEHVKDLVDQSAQELSSVNTELAQEMEQVREPPGVRIALERSLAVEEKVQDASDRLTRVNHALQEEVNTRHALEAQLATVTLDEQAARHAAMHDALTGLPNRTLLENRLEHGLAQAKRHDRTLAVLFLDLDGFKQINDAHGHDVGDALLKIVANRLRDHARDDDTVSRFGGDEFVCLLTEIEGDPDAALVAQKIADAIQLPCQLSSGVLVIKPSIGIAIFPKHGETAADLIKSADIAMYTAKRSKSGFALAS